MSYEVFRADFASRLPAILNDQSQMQDVLFALDSVAASYDVSRKCTDLIVHEGLPDSVRLYLASKAVDNLTKGTLANYYNTLKMFFQQVHKPIEKIAANDVRLYLHNYKITRHVKDNTLEHIRIELNSFFEWCVDEDFLTRNPIRKKISKNARSRNVYRCRLLSWKRFATPVRIFVKKQWLTCSIPLPAVYRSLRP